MLYSQRKSLSRNLSHQALMKCKDSQLSLSLKSQDFINRFNKLKDNRHQSCLPRSINIKEITPQSLNESTLLKQKAQDQLAFQNNASQFQSTKYTILNIQKNQYFSKNVKRNLSKRKTLDCSKLQFTQAQSEEVICEKENINGYQLNGFKKRLQKKYSFEILSNSSDGKTNGTGLRKSNFHKRQSKQYYPQVLIYYDFLKAQSLIQEVQLEKVENYQDQPIYFSVGKGNNNQIIKETLKKRWWWKESNNDKKESLNFLWTQLRDKDFALPNSEKKDKSIKNMHLVQFSLTKQQQTQPQRKYLHNHCSSNKYFGSKLGMYATLKNYCKQRKLNIYKIIHPIFSVQKFMDQQWKSFTSTYFQSLQINKLSICDINANKKYWLVKENNKNLLTNKIFCTYKDIKKYVEKQSKKGTTFIIEQYLSKPFLYKKRKFDIKCYVLISRLKQKTNFYLHKEGIISIACQKFDIMDLNNQFSHFITDSIQTKHRNFGEFQPGNKIDFQTFQNYLNNLHGTRHDFMGKAFPQMRETISQFLIANYHILNKQKAPCFQLIECAFILDEDFKPWIIDVHANPCLQTYCPTQQKVIKTVIEDTFKHTIDLLFPPPLEWLQSKHQSLSNLTKNSGFILISENFKDEASYQNGIQNYIIIKSNDKIYEDQLVDDTECSQTLNRTRDLEYLFNEGLKNKE